MSSTLFSRERWPLVISGIGILLGVTLAIERVLLVADIVSVPTLYRAGVLTSLPFILALVYGGYWLANSSLSAERYPRIISWLLGVLVGFSLLINGIVLTMPTAWHLSATRWAASVGGCFGVMMGILDAFMIESRTASEQLRTQKRELQQQYERVQRYQALQNTLQNIIIELSDRKHLEDAVCSELASDTVPLVCCCDATLAGEISVRTAAGPLADHTPLLTTLTTDGTPVADALNSDEQTVLNLEDTEVPWVDTIRMADITSVVVTPLIHDGVTYGALVVCLTDTTDNTALDQQMVAEIAGALAYGIHSIEQEAVLRSNQSVRVTLSVWDETSYLCSLVADDRFPTGARLSVVEAGSSSPDTAMHYFLTDSSTDGVSDNLTAVLASIDSVASVESRSDTNAKDGVVATARVTRPTVLDTVVRCGGTVQTVTLTADEVQVVAEFSADTVLSDVVAQMRDRLDTVRFVSKTQTDPDDDILNDSLDEVLTEKQREALEVAYFNGFFDRPQRKTADEIADVLGVARSTFLSHVRTAEATVLDECITGPEAEEIPPRHPSEMEEKPSDSNYSA